MKKNIFGFIACGVFFSTYDNPSLTECVQREEVPWSVRMFNTEGSYVFNKHQITVITEDNVHEYKEFLEYFI